MTEGAFYVVLATVAVAAVIYVIITVARNTRPIVDLSRPQVIEWRLAYHKNPAFIAVYNENGEEVYTTIRAGREAVSIDIPIDFKGTVQAIWEKP